MASAVSSINQKEAVKGMPGLTTEGKRHDGEEGHVSYWQDSSCRVESASDGGTGDDGTVAGPREFSLPPGKSKRTGEGLHSGSAELEDAN